MHSTRHLRARSPGRRALRLLGGPSAALATLAAAVLAGSAGTAGAATAAADDLTSVPVTAVRGTSGSVPLAQPTGSLPDGAYAANPELRGPKRLGAGARSSGATDIDSLVNRSFATAPTAQSVAVAANKPPIVSPTAITGGTAGLTRSFEGINLFDQRFANNGNQFTVEPPDQGLCVGNGFVFESVNSAVRIYRTNGTAATKTIDANTFYGYPAAINRTTGRFGPSVIDPTCIYDAPTGRFFNVVFTLEVVPKTGAITGRSTLDIAVSKTSNPLQGFNIYRIPAQNDGTQGTPKHAKCPCLPDFPHIGADANGFFITTNEFQLLPGGSGFNGAQVYGFDKRALARGADRVRGQLFENTFIRDGRVRQPGFTVWPAVSAQSDYNTRDNGTENFLSTTAVFEDDGIDDRLVVWSAVNTRSLATGQGRMSLRRAYLDSQTYGVPPKSEQKPGPLPLKDCLLVECFEGLGPSTSEQIASLDSSDSRILGVWYAAGKVWGTAGTSALVKGNLKAAAAHFEVNPGATPAQARMASQGYIAVERNNLTYPTIGVLPNGKGVIGFTLVGQGYFPSAAYAKISPNGSTGPVQISRLGQAPQDGFTGYRFFVGDPVRPRWGDYGASSVYAGQVWMASEYIESRCSFAKYRNDPTCGNERAPFGNWSTRISAVTP